MYNDKQLHVCIVAGTTGHIKSHHHEQEDTTPGKVVMPPAPVVQLRHAPTHYPYQRAQPAQLPKPQNMYKAFFAGHYHES